MSPTQTHLDAEIVVAPLLAARAGPAAFFHQDSEAVRFWVPVADWLVGASIRKAVMHYSFRPQDSKKEPMDTYARHWPNSAPRFSGVSRAVQSSR